MYISVIICSLTMIGFVTVQEYILVCYISRNYRTHQWYTHIINNIVSTPKYVYLFYLYINHSTLLYSDDDGRPDLMCIIYLYNTLILQQ